MSSEHQDVLSPASAPAEVAAWSAWQNKRAAWQSLLRQWLDKRRADGWYAQQSLQLTAATTGERAVDLLFRALGQAPRRLGRDDLALDEAERQAARALDPGFDAERWSIDQTARIGLILTVASRLRRSPDFVALLDELARQGDMQEQIALYQGFALYPQDPVLLPRAGEAIRCGIRPVFAAFALRNPWPSSMLPQPVWNQMIVKTFFLELPLWPIQGLTARANPDLSTILCDLLAERAAAGRPLNPEVWRMLAWAPTERGLALLQGQFASASATSAQGRALRLSAQESPHAAVRRLAGQQPPGDKFDTAEWAALAQWPE